MAMAVPSSHLLLQVDDFVMEMVNDSGSSRMKSMRDYLMGVVCRERRGLAGGRPEGR
jgi:hypothetical protein